MHTPHYSDTCQCRNCRAVREDVVVYIVKDDKTLISWGRETLLEAEKFIKQPKYPAHDDDEFIAVDDWGGGKVVAATDKSLVGMPKQAALTELRS
jgi:hypothetical protein